MSELSVPRPAANPQASSLDVLARLAASRLEGTDIDWRPIAAAHGLSLVGKPVDGARIPTAREHAFVEEIATASRDPLFAWHLGAISVKSFGLPGYVILNASTVAEALDTLALLMPSVCEAIHYHRIVDDGDATLVYVSSDTRQNAVFALRFTLHVLRELIGPDFRATRVGLSATDRKHLPLLSRQIAAPVTAELPFTFVTFPARHLGVRVAGADERLAATLRPYWQREQANMARHPPVVRSRLEGAIVRSLHEGPPTLDQIARNLHVNRSKVEAEMAALGGYRIVVDHVRHRLAKSLVLHSDLTMAAIAAVLGYSEPGALNHAYKRWTGRTPNADRKANLSSGSLCEAANSNLRAGAVHMPPRAQQTGRHAGA